MSTTVLSPTVTQASATQPAFDTDVCQAIVFAIAGQLLALPLPAVLRVLPNSDVSNNNKDNRLIYIEQQPIPIVDLRPSLQPLSRSSVSSTTSTPQPFLLLAALQGSSAIAISVDAVPSLMTLPKATMQALPHIYRQKIGNIASHVAVMAQPNEPTPLTILLLDLHQLSPS